MRISDWSSDGCSSDLAEKNGGAVWISTYTRNLQHQIDGELDRLYPDRRLKALRAVIRKGRENYLCLLNLEDSARGLGQRPVDAVALRPIARWARAEARRVGHECVSPSRS